MWQGKKKALTFSYDDGVTQDRRLVQLFNDYGLKGTFNLNSALFSDDTGEKGWNEWERGLWIARIRADEVAALYKGHEVAVHACNHPDLTTLSDEDLRAELEDDRKALSALCGYEPVGMAYPYGTTDERVQRAVAAAGLHYGRTVAPSHDFELPEQPFAWAHTCHHDDEQLFTLVQRFLELEAARPQVLTIWGHSYEFDVKENWERMERLCALLAGHEDIFYATNREILGL